MPVRWRLTLYFALILCVILGVSGFVNYVLLQRNLTNQIDSALRDHSSRIYDSINTALPGALSRSSISATIPQINEFASPGTYVQVIDRDGYLVAKSNNLEAQELPVNLSLIERGFSGSAAIQTVAVGDDASLRIMVSPLYFQDETLLLEVAQSSNYLDSAMSQVRWVIIVSVSVALGLSVALGGVIVRGTLSPVSQITKLARNIETGQDLSRRIGYGGPMDEIGELASTFDKMIERLEGVFESQKHFVADASHELRSPITVIRGNLDLLKRYREETERQASLRAIESETARMTKLVNNLLLLAEVDSGHLVKPQDVSLEEVLQQEIKRVRALAGSRRLVIRHAENLRVPGDAQRLRQLIANLIDNAIRHTPEDGAIVLSLSREGDWARLDVEDTGEGIPAKHLPHIFERFYRVDRARSRDRGGAGLGLAIVKQIAEQHGGRVAARSEAGGGSIFTVWLKL
jgi:two-component system OmpR family sensor kinase